MNKIKHIIVRFRKWQVLMATGTTMLIVAAIFVGSVMALITMPLPFGF